MARPCKAGPGRQTGTEDNTPWAAFRASHQPFESYAPPPCFRYSWRVPHTVAMIRHSLDVVKNAMEHLNPGQMPVVTFDHPLFTLAKQIHWKWPESYREDKLVVMFGGLHIEMAALKMLGDWLQREWLGACTGAS